MGRLVDSRIFINDTSVYYFPFFDTCVGTYNRIDSIKVEFDNGFYYKWTKLNYANKGKVLIVAQVNSLFPSYLSFDKRRYRTGKSTLHPIED